MVQRQLRERGIASDVVLDVMQQVPRHLFVSQQLRHEAYEDHPLPIGCGQTISQPYMVARMTELCCPPNSRCDRALEIGAGSGYQSAVLARLFGQIYATEIVPQLAETARAALAAADVENVTLAGQDGSGGWPRHAPFDAILVAAGAPAIPAPLGQQLADGGRLVIPVGSRGCQILKCIIRRGDSFETTVDTACRFVDLRGEHGWQQGRD